MSGVDDELSVALDELERATALLRALRQAGTSGTIARSRARMDDAARLLAAARVRVDQALARSRDVRERRAAKE